MKKLLFFFGFLFFVQTASCQPAGIDSMLQKIAVEKNDDARFNIIYRSMVSIGESDPLTGLQYAQSLLDYSQSKKDKIGEAYAMSFMGKMYGVSGNLEKGLRYALKGNEIAEQTANKKLMALSSSMLGLIYINLADLPKAIGFYTASAQLAEKANYMQAQIWAFQHLSEMYLEMNQVDSALVYAQKDYEMSQRIRYNDFISYTLVNLGAIQGKIGNTALAQGYFDLAIQVSYRSNSPRQLNTAFTAKAKYFNSIHQKDSAIRYAKKALGAVENTDFVSYGVKPAQLLLDLYRYSNVDSAFKYSELYRTTNEHLFNSKAVQQVQLMTFEEELRQRKLSEEKLKASEERSQNIQLVLIAFGIITFIIVFLLLSRSIITNTRIIEFLGVIALLIVFEFLNLLLHPFLERITSHSPLLMLLALFCIAALLVPLHHKVERWATTKLVEKNKALRLAAANRTIEQLEKK